MLLFLNDLGLDEPGLNKIIKVGYRLLKLITFYCWSKEAHAWTIPEGSSALKQLEKYIVILKMDL